MLLLCLTSVRVIAQDTDILFYDKDWKGVSSKAFAAFYRVLPKKRNNNLHKPFRDYYITGELQAEGGFISLDEKDDKKSVFDGDWTTYYRNGKVEQKGHRDNGVEQGEYVKYGEKGLILIRAMLKNGKPDGIYTQFNEDGSLCMQMEYQNGEPVYDWYMLSNKDGLCSKIDRKSNQPIYESPTLNDKKVEYIKGAAWPYYNTNGIVIGMTNNEVKDYGKYYQIPIIVSNKSLYPIDFDPNKITATLEDKKGQQVILTVLSAEQYMKKVKRSQNWDMFGAGLSEGLAAAGAGYSSSTTNSTYNAHSSSYGNAYAYGSGGYAYGNYSGNSTYHGSSSSTTTSYNGLAAYQAQVIASERIANYENALLTDRQAKDEGYLKKTTVYPGQSISGYVNINRVKGVSMNIVVDINGAKYNFPWNVSL